MFVAPLNRTILDVAKRAGGLRAPAWIDSASSGAFSVFAWDPTAKVICSSRDKALFLEFLGRFSANKTHLASCVHGDFKFCGGWIGYMSYECYAFSETI